MEQREKVNETIYRYFLGLDNDGLAAGALADALTDAVCRQMSAAALDEGEPQSVGAALLRVLIRRLDI